MMRKLIVASVVGVLAGCGGNGLVRVSGVVTLDGKPAQNAVLTFVPTGAGEAAAASTDLEGKYVVTSAGGVGARPGHYSVKIKSREMPQSKSNPMEGLAPGSPEYIEAYKAQMTGGGNRTEYKAKPKGEIPAKYNTDGALTAEVGSADTVVNFDLISK
jgi:hypothetical protein